MVVVRAIVIEAVMGREGLIAGAREDGREIKSKSVRGG